MTLLEGMVITLSPDSGTHRLGNEMTGDKALGFLVTLSEKIFIPDILQLISEDIHRCFILIGQREWKPSVSLPDFAGS